MKIGNLEFSPLKENKSIIAENVLNFFINSDLIDEIKVAEIDEQFIGGVELCEHYNIDKSQGANCLVVEGVRGESKTYCALIVPVGYKYNMSNIVRKEIGARIVSVANLEATLNITKMEYGSITPFGIPNNWLTFIDPLVLINEYIIMGSGLKKSKILIPSNILLSLPNSKILKGLAVTI